jgi:two-component system sensor kinase FixL
MIREERHSEHPFFRPHGAATASPDAVVDLRILVVEDDRIDRLALRRHVTEQKLPYALTETGTIQEARAQLAAGRFDAVLLDNRLPDGEGVELLDVAADIPVVFVTGVKDLGLAVRALKGGAVDFLVKDAERNYLQMLAHTLSRALEERRTRAALRSSQAQLRQIVDSMPAAAFTCDADGYITYFNRQTIALWGREPRLYEPADRFCGTVKFFQPDGTPILREECWRALTLRREVSTSEMVAEFDDGHRRHVLAYANPVFEASGLLAGAINIWVDVTEMRRLEHRHRVLEAQLNHSRKLEAVGTLAGGVAHEFNNQLAAIMGNLQLAELELASDHDATPLLREALNSTRKASDIVQRMLAFTHQARGTQLPARLDVVVRDALPLVRSNLPPGVTLEVNLAEDAPNVVCCVTEINQVVRQLIANATQAMHGRSGPITLDLTHGAPPAQIVEHHPQVRPHHTVCLTVRDTGIGMKPDVLSRVFEPFFTTRGPNQGTGLGLAGVYGTVQRHGAAIVIESAPEQGTVVRIFFPPVGAQAAVRPPVLRAAPEDSARPGAAAVVDRAAP